MCSSDLFPSHDTTSYNFDWYQGSGNLFGGTIDISLPASSDYWKRDNLFSLRYCNWNKDLFMGILPNSQFGDVAIIDFDNSGNKPDVFLGLGDSNSKVGVASRVSSNTAPVPFFALNASSSNTLPEGSTLCVDLGSLQSQFHIYNHL